VQAPQRQLLAGTPNSGSHTMARGGQGRRAVGRWCVRGVHHTPEVCTMCRALPAGAAQPAQCTGAVPLGDMQAAPSIRLAICPLLLLLLLPWGVSPCMRGACRGAA
jgi:hypothetical protein